MRSSAGSFIPLALANTLYQLSSENILTIVARFSPFFDLINNAATNAGTFLGNSDFGLFTFIFYPKRVVIPALKKDSLRIIKNQTTILAFPYTQLFVKSAISHKRIPVNFLFWMNQSQLLPRMLYWRLLFSL